MERTIGEVFECNGKKYIVKEEISVCEGCSFFNCDCMSLKQTIGNCGLSNRLDHKGVIFVEYKEEKVMENLLNCKGKRFKCKICGVSVEGKIQVERDKVFLCQNIRNGGRTTDTLGYSYSWYVNTGSKEDLEDNNVTDFKLINRTKEDIETYKDWQVGDKIIHINGNRGEIIFRSGELVIFKYYNNTASTNYTVEKLHKNGWRLDEQPIEEPIVEMTMEEIAKLKGIPVEKLRIKDK